PICPFALSRSGRLQERSRCGLGAEGCGIEWRRFSSLRFPCRGSRGLKKGRRSLRLHISTWLSCIESSLGPSCLSLGTTRLSAIGR
ncbi:hypothetical protein PENTCL1PPCAC_29155, partial [Pristionchus entomophagus]